MIYNRSDIEINYSILKEIKETFEIFDVEKINKLNLDDLKIALISLGLRTTDDEVTRIIKQFKINNGNRIYLTYQEFNNMVTMRLYDHDSSKEHKKLFGVLTKDKDPVINEQFLSELSVRFHENMTEAEIKELLHAGDFDCDGEINEKDFTKILQKTHFN